ncbi:MAG TPA: zinc transporter ZntB [Hyphomonadaceae bacterium]|nr:zinc transporter ZntB [Hyphomonadaceae bacterium]
MPVAPVERNDHAEPNADAFIFGFDFPADGVIEKVDWKKIKPTAACPRAGWRWLHFNRLAPETREWLEESSDLDETVITALLQSETRPRCAAYEDGLLLNLRGINHNPGAEPEDMISVRIWATQNLVITMRSYPVKAVHEVREEVASGMLENPSPGGLLVTIAERLIDKIEPVVDQLKDEADEFEETLLTSREKLPATALAEFRRTILILRRYILPQREAMAQLQREGRLLFDQDHAMHLRETGDRITRIAEELDSVRDRATVLQDQVAGQRQEQLNTRLLVLSIVSAFFLPLTFLTGLLGMNLDGIPFAHEPWSFSAVVGLTVVLGGGLLGFLKWQRWI